MKRPNLLYLIIILQIIIAIAIAAFFTCVEVERARLDELIFNQIALSDQLTDVQMDIMLAITAIQQQTATEAAADEAVERCFTSSDVRTEFETRRQDDCIIDEYELQLQQLTCARDGEVTRQFDWIVSEQLHSRHVQCQDPG